jgi:hypothetical protein
LKSGKPRSVSRPFSQALRHVAKQPVHLVVSEAEVAEAEVDCVRYRGVAETLADALLEQVRCRTVLVAEQASCLPEDTEL